MAAPVSFLNGVTHGVKFTGGGHSLDFVSLPPRIAPHPVLEGRRTDSIAMRAVLPRLYIVHQSLSEDRLYIARGSIETDASIAVSWALIDWKVGVV